MSQRHYRGGGREKKRSPHQFIISQGSQTTCAQAHRDSREDPVGVHVFAREALDKVLGVQVRVLALVDETAARGAVDHLGSLRCFGKKTHEEKETHLMTSMGTLMSLTRSFWL